MKLLIALFGMTMAGMLFITNIAYGQGPAIQRRTIDDLQQEMVAKDANQLDFLVENTLHGSMRRITSEQKDTARYDCVFIVIAGKGESMVGGSRSPLQKGAILYIPKGADCRWYNITDPLWVMQWCSLGERKSMKTPVTSAEAAAFTLEGVGKARVAGGNVWNAFVRRPSMVFGLYMLPASVGGDSALTHQWDEINLITAGKGKFQVGEEVMDVGPGDIVYVRKGNPHYFHSLNGDLDILIFFEMASMAGR